METIRIDRIRVYLLNGCALNGYVLNGYVLVGYVLNGYVLVGYVLVGYVLNGYVWDMCGVRYANNLLKNPATKRLSGKSIWLNLVLLFDDRKLSMFWQEFV